MDAPATVTHDAYLEVERDGRWTAQILDLPGCFAFGRDEAGALAALTASLPTYYAWLRSHDDYMPDVRGPWQVVPRETLNTRPVGEHEVNAFFAPDAQAVDDEELDWGLALLGWAHEDLMRMARALPAAALDVPPPQGGRTLRQILDHVGQSQLWFVSRLDASPVPTAISQLGGETVERLDRVHNACESRLRGANEEQRARVLDHEGERWSMRKVLRRSVQHTREHTAEVQRLMGGR